MIVFEFRELHYLPCFTNDLCKLVPVTRNTVVNETGRKPAVRVGNLALLNDVMSFYDWRERGIECIMEIDRRGILTRLVGVKNY